MAEVEIERYRSKLFGIAYRMLGCVVEAEDAVQDTYLRWHQQGQADGVDNPEAYLVTVTTRLCIDALKSARARRETYVGTWLPEPLISDTANDPESHQQRAESLSFAFMMLLEQLNPVERAVYILRVAFELKHREIAGILDRSEADSRQLLRRAQGKIKIPHERFQSRDVDQDQLFGQFLGAAAGNDLTPLFDHLAEDVAAYTDGGGKVRAALRVLNGKPRVIEFIRRVLPQQDPDSEIELCRMNGQPAIRQFSQGVTTGLISVDFVEGKAQQLFIVRNPDKLINFGLEYPVI